MSDTLYIVIPAYNESSNIASVIGEWSPVLDCASQDSRLVIVNDGSKDDTLSILHDLQGEYPRLVVLDKENGGHGAACLYGYRYAIEKHAEYVFQTDSDGQTLAAEFPPFWEERDQYDIQIGWRRGRQDGPGRIVVTKTLRALIRLMFGARVTDANTPFRLMDAKLLEEYLAVIPEDFFLSNVLISILAVKRNARVRFRHITFRPRQGGINSINFKRIFGIGLKSLREFGRFRRDHRAYLQGKE